MGQLPSKLVGLLLLTVQSAGAARMAAPTNVAPVPAPVAAADWPLERVTLTDQKQYAGLVKSESPTGIEFIEVHRPRGKPMFLVVRPIDRKSIDTLERLSPEEQATLRGRLESHMQRMPIEAARMEDLVLQSEKRDGQLLWKYDGQWFALESTASESMTRRSIVRLEQIFAAYRQVLPPRWKSPQRLHIQIFGASDQYQRALAEQSLKIVNPAVYLPAKNLILAGSNLNEFDAALAEVDRQHDKIRAQLDALVDESRSRSNELYDTLANSGVPAAERQKVVAAEEKQWEERRREARRKMALLERGNTAKFDVVAGQMLRRLAHEAFHAYLETFVYPRAAYDVPRWLNEGLAQVFEAGLLEVDSLRIDNPNTLALARLQSELADGQPLGLAELLEAGSEAFLAGHAGAGATASRAYYYSWGLAYYLAFERGVLGRGDFETYLDPKQPASNAVERFEKLVGMPLVKFEAQWRKAVLALKR
ncbi:MAG: DUF1570 domain-containing protein [Pirellulales bacterium]